MAAVAQSDTDQHRRSDSGQYRRDKGRVIGWVAATLGAIGIAVAAWAHGKLWDTAIAQHGLETRANAQEKRLDGIDGKLDRILERLGAAKP